MVFSSEKNHADPKSLGRVNLAGALALLNEAALALRCFAQLQNPNDSDESTSLITRLNTQIKGYETERAELHAELQRIEHFARSSWTSYKAAEAELNALRSAVDDHLPEPS
jgi:septal ring factor EnvC (AmiA/AmiB activator)